MTHEERFVRIERRMNETAELIAGNAEQIAALHVAIDKTNLAVSRTHQDVVKLERKIDQLTSVIAYMAGKDPMEFARS